MKRRKSVRLLAMIWATLQLASPGIASVADGLLSSATAAGPTTHVEARTGAGCHAVHSPDCALCRYLSHTAAQPSSPACGYQLQAPGVPPNVEYRDALPIALALPHGRAPPTI